MIDPSLLRDINFFSELNDQDLGIMANVLKEQDFSSGSTIFKEGADGASLYIIKRGEVKACKSMPEGDLMTLTLQKDGEIFGTMSFLDGRPRSATIVAITDTKTYVLDKVDFESLIDNHPRLIYKLLKNIVFSSHSIVRGMNTRYLEMINYMWGRKR